MSTEDENFDKRGGHNLSQGKKFNYPEAKRDENKFVELFGHKIPDFYQYLEKDTEFLQQQTNFANEILQKSKSRDSIKRKMKEIADFNISYLPTKVEGSYYYEISHGISPPYIVKVNDLNDPKPVTLFDLTHASSMVSLDNWYVSPDGKYLAVVIALQQKLHHRETIYIIEIPESSDTSPSKLTQKMLETKDEEMKLLHKLQIDASKYKTYMIPSLEPSVKVAWFESNGFFYSTKSGILYHKLHSSKETDAYVVVYEADIIPAPIMTHDNKYLFISCRSYNHGGNILYFANPKSHKNKYKAYQMVDEWDRMYKYITNYNNFVYLLTSKKASTNRVIRIDMCNRKPRCHCEWEEIISRDKTDLLVDAVCAGKDYLLLQYMHDGLAFLRIHSLKTGITSHQIEHNIGDLTLGNRIDHSDPEFFYAFESVHIPPIVYRANVFDCVQKNQPPQILFLNKPKNYNFNDYAVDFVTFPSHDSNVEIPMFVVHKREDRRPVTTILKVEGGFGRFFWLKYNTCTVAFMKIFGGSIALVFVRGGGERGRKWANSGKRMKKERAIKDYQAAAEFLITENYTSSSKLIAEGCDNGGLIVSASVVQKPQLFGAVIPIIPITDMVRFTIGPHAGFLIEEYGDVQHDKDALEYALKYSPLHHVIVGTGDKAEYPPILICTITTSPVIQSWHATKFAAALQYAAGKSVVQKNIILLKKVRLTKFNVRNFGKMLDFYADEFAFIGDNSDVILE